MARVSDLLDVSYGHSLELNRLARSSSADAINFVSRTAKNNGVSARVERITGVEPAQGGLVTVALGGTVLETFLQPTPFYCGRDVAILTPVAPMTLAEKLWWVSAIRANRYRYSYGRQANRTLADLELPVRVPDYVVSATVPDFSAMRAPASTEPPPALETGSWRIFRYEEIFEIVRGEFTPSVDIKPGDTPLVRSTERNNGVTGRVTLPTRVHPAGTISVARNGSVGEAFYQPHPFHASDDVHVFYPRQAIGRETALFLCVLIRAEKYRYGYGRKWSLERMKKSVMRLPVTPQGEPDWAFAERFVRSLPYSSSIESTR